MDRLRVGWVCGLLVALAACGASEGNAARPGHGDAAPAAPEVVEAAEVRREGLDAEARDLAGALPDAVATDARPDERPPDVRPEEPAPEVGPGNADLAEVEGPAPEAAAPPLPRVVAVGDLHADLTAARAAFRLAGVIDASDHWNGGTDVVIQTGDVLDRGAEERELMDWMEERRAEAQAAGGDVVMLAGNHEDNNLEAYYPDVNPASCAAYAGLADDPAAVDPAVAVECRPRAASLLPGGTYAKVIARKRVAVIAADSVFVHGGLAPQYVASAATLDDMNARWRKFARGESGPWVDEDIYETLWDRRYSDDDTDPDCEAAAVVLERLGVSRMVVGHTPWDDINAACDGRVWRIDTGMSAYYGGKVEVLELVGNAVTPLVAGGG